MSFVFNRIINGDCETVMKDLKSQGVSFDLVLTDPPYNKNKDFGNDSDKLTLEEFQRVNKIRIGLCYQLLKPQGSIIWFAIHDNVGFLQNIMFETGFFYRRLNIWHYDNGFSRSSKTLAHDYEPFLWYSKSKDKWTFNADDIRVPYKTERVKNPVYYFNSKGEKVAWMPNPLGAMHSDIWDYPTLAGKNFAAERTEHPTQKPESLITELIKAFCPKDQDGKYCGTILDPFNGSGTLSVCCEKLNKQGHHIKWIGIEIEKKWCDVAEERLRKI
jgi:DNA modification methylase